MKVSRYRASGMIQSNGTEAMSVDRYVVTPSIKLEGTNASATQRRRSASVGEWESGRVGEWESEGVGGWVSGRVGESVTAVFDGGAGLAVGELLRSCAFTLPLSDSPTLPLTRSRATAQATVRIPSKA